MGGRLRTGYFVEPFFPMVDGVIMAADIYARRLSAVADGTGDYDKLGDALGLADH